MGNYKTNVVLQWETGKCSLENYKINNTCILDMMMEKNMWNITTIRRMLSIFRMTFSAISHCFQCLIELSPSPLPPPNVLDFIRAIKADLI